MNPKINGVLGEIREFLEGADQDESRRLDREMDKGTVPQSAGRVTSFDPKTGIVQVTKKFRKNDNPALAPAAKSRNKAKQLKGTKALNQSRTEEIDEADAVDVFIAEASSKLVNTCGLDEDTALDIVLSLAEAGTDVGLLPGLPELDASEEEMQEWLEKAAECDLSEQAVIFARENVLNEGDLAINTAGSRK